MSQLGIASLLLLIALSARNREQASDLYSFILQTHCEAEA